MFNKSTIYLVDITAVVDNVGTKQIFRFSSASYVTSPTSTPPNTYYEERLKQPALVRMDMFSSGRTYGASQVGVGELVLSNADGGLDFLQDYGFDGQPLVLRVGSPDQDISAFQVVLTTTMEQVEITQRELRVRVRDKQSVLNDPIQQNLYLGTGGLEGSDLSVKGQPKPLIFGKVFNILPISVDSNLFIYQISDSNIHDVSFVYDRGVALTKETNYASITELTTVAPDAGQYRQFQGYFRLGARPTGILTCDVVETNLTTNHSVAEILKRIALRMGIPSGDIDNTSISNLNSLNNSEVGIYIPNAAFALEVMDEIAESIGAFYGFDSNGKFKVGRLDSPSGLADITLISDSILEIDKVASRDSDKGIPSYRIDLKYAKNYTLQDRSNLAPAVADARVDELSVEYRTVVAEDLGVLNKHNLSPEIVKNTLLVSAVAAQNEANRLLNIYKVRRDVFTLRVRLDSEIISLLAIGKIIDLFYYRYGLNSGKKLLIIGLEVDYQANKAELTLWG